MQSEKKRINQSPNPIQVPICSLISICILVRTNNSNPHILKFLKKVINHEKKLRKKDGSFKSERPLSLVPGLVLGQGLTFPLLASP